jgi:hypothetical protein
MVINFFSQDFATFKIIFMLPSMRRGTTTKFYHFFSFGLHTKKQKQKTKKGKVGDDGSRNIA